MLQPIQFRPSMLQCSMRLQLLLLNHYFFCSSLVLFAIQNGAPFSLLYSELVLNSVAFAQRIFTTSTADLRHEIKHSGSGDGMQRTHTHAHSNLSQHFRWNHARLLIDFEMDRRTQHVVSTCRQPNWLPFRVVGIQYVTIERTMENTTQFLNDSRKIAIHFDD